MPPYLSVQDVIKTYGKFTALDKINLDLYQGETIALLGPNGAGKTTFIKILATLLTKTSGKVFILGRDLDQEEKRIRHLFGYVGQDTERSAYARLTVRENLQFFGKLRGLNRTSISERIDKLAQSFNFQANLDKLFMLLSGGQKQTVVIMRALLHDPPLIYLDEPTKGLDPLVSKDTRAFLQDYVRRENKGLLLTSHILSEVDEMADRVALIHEGKIIVIGTPAELKQTVGVPEFFEIKRACLPPQVYEAIMQLSTVSCVTEREPGWVSFGLTDSLQGIESIVHTLRQHDAHVQFRHHIVSLEDAFIYHVNQSAGLPQRFSKG